MDERLDGARDAGPAGSARPTLPAPIEPKPSSVPPENGVGLDDDQRPPPSGPQAAQPRPEQPVDGPQLRGVTADAGARRPTRGRGVWRRSQNELQQIFPLIQVPFAI